MKIELTEDEKECDAFCPDCSYRIKFWLVITEEFITRFPRYKAYLNSSLGICEECLTFLEKL